jgi:hypothetical protein
VFSRRLSTDSYQYSDAGKTPKRKHITYKTRQKFKIKNIKCCRQKDFLKKIRKIGKKVNIAFVAYSTTPAKIREGLGLWMLKEGKKMQCSQSQRDGLLVCNFFLVKCHFTVNKLSLSNNQSRIKKNYEKDIYLFH